MQSLKYFLFLLTFWSLLLNDTNLYCIMTLGLWVILMFLGLNVFHSVAVGHYSASGSAVWRDFVVWLHHRALVSVPLNNSALPSPAFHWNDTLLPNSCELLPPIEEKITHFMKNISWVISLWAQYPHATLIFISTYIGFKLNCFLVQFFWRLIITILSTQIEDVI